MLVQLNRYEQAVAAYDRAIGIDPQSALAWCNRCNALINLTEYELALAASEKAINIDPQMREAWACKGSALRQLGRGVEADTALARAEVLGHQAF